MTPLQPVQVDPSQIFIAIRDYMLFFERDPASALRQIGMPPGTSAQDVKAKLEKYLREAHAEAQIWRNEKYQVAVYAKDKPPQGWPAMIHLSIKRVDREPIMDWRDVQEIKNQLVGPECEGVQLFPAESRLVDTANQYHVYVIADAGTHFPFGFTAGRVVRNSVEGAVAKQRDTAKYGTA